jgi:hypothetical protein
MNDPCFDDDINQRTEVDLENKNRKDFEKVQKKTQFMFVVISCLPSTSSWIFSIL